MGYVKKRVISFQVKKTCSMMKNRDAEQKGIIWNQLNLTI